MGTDSAYIQYQDTITAARKEALTTLESMPFQECIKNKESLSLKGWERFAKSQKLNTNHILGSLYQQTFNSCINNLG